MMQENNNFDTIISTWRRMSGEQIESVTVSMSGDSSDKVHKKRDEEASLLVPERLKGPIATAASAGPARIAEIPSENSCLEDMLLKCDNDDGKICPKEAAGDAKDKEDDNVENKDTLSSYPDEKKESYADKVDSVYVTQQAIKVPPRSTASTPEDEDCGIKCLYYTLHCCDCVLM